MAKIQKVRRHPVLGDEITFQEHVSWIVQTILRRWTFIIGFTVVSVAWWIKPALFHDDGSYIHWQLLASYLAILIESVVGIGMFGQTTKDAQILRRLERLEKSELDVMNNDLAVDRETKLLVEQIARKLELIP